MPRLPALRLGARGAGRLVVVGLVVCAAGWMWLRDSSLVGVRDVTVTGVSGRSAGDVRSALRLAAAQMTTLHVREDALREAVEGHPLVRDLVATADFPRALRIRVIEHDAVATVKIRGRRVPLAADGTILRGARLHGLLARLAGDHGESEGKVADTATLRAAALLGQAPRALRPLIESVQRDRAGFHVQLRSGPRLEFGRPSRARAKWLAAARVLAHDASAGAQYVDLRTPERPIAGSFPDDPVSPATGEVSQSQLQGNV